MSSTLSSSTTSSKSQVGPAWRGASYPVQVWVLTGRSLRALLRDPRLVIFNLLHPLIMLLVFSQVFGKAMLSAVAEQGGNYVNYLMPAILVTTGIGAALESGVGLITDMKNGVIARFRALPIHPSSVLVARSLSDLVRTAAQLTIVVVVAALLFDFSPAGGASGVTAALLLSLLVSWSLTWVFLAMAAWLRSEEVMNSVGFLAMFPLMFASNAFVPIESLPGWLQAVAKVNPLTYTVDAARGLSLALPMENGPTAAVVVSTLLGALSVLLAVRGFRRPT
ncbi:MAG: ABC transporter permease, partial [Saccharopolyspora rectivirgula]